MSANRAVWGRVRSRLRAFPEHLAAWAAQAAAYGRCVQASTAPGGRLSKDLCARGFEALRCCFAAAAKKTLKGGLLGGALSTALTPIC
ncbi:NADH dehydrogenase [ubiquinone] 1 alpha subcomplex assembly factor 8-like [Nycticebus coucang]|uniref:NADH dehydrogenase [ubiquinone] 1 alpha subcomplex assembly factor 8-like n=1 Tax=Nycticebus coucang TaxID=9470 RepID=UPI00234DEFB3|nr:NADH dehydrogenase [ubiquinone] 1 alpha subcomplex assembly factor 8-like [Nycticebus coucang]